MKTLKQAATDLVEFIERENLCDEGANDGDGYIDEWRSTEFE